MTHIFVFSSPLQYFFASLVYRKLGKPPAVGRYYEFAKDFRAVFAEIDDLLGTSIPFRALDPTEKVPEGFALLIGNRFNRSEVSLARRSRVPRDRLYLYEEGISIYLAHEFRHKRRNDRNIILRLQNAIRALRHQNVSHLRLDAFNGIYSVFPEIPYLPSHTKQISIEAELLALQQLHSSGSRSCIVLSQWLTTYGLLDEDGYLNYLRSLAKRLDAYETVYFKAHPRDPKHLTDRVFAETALQPMPDQYARVPVELFLAHNSEMDVLGFWTSAMFYATRAFGMRSFTLFPDIVKTFPHCRGLREMWDTARPLLRQYGIGDYGGL